MTAPAIQIASPQAGVSASRGSGISAMPGRGAQANGSSSAEGAGDGQWQQSLRQAGVRQQDSSQDSPISTANGSGAGDAQASDPAGVQVAQIFSLHARAQSAAALNVSTAKQLAQDASISTKAVTATKKAAGSPGSAAHAKTSGKADAHQKGAAANPAQNLLASLTLPAAVTVAVPQANSKSGAGATAADEPFKPGLPSSADAATALLQGSESGNLTGSMTGNTAGRPAAAAEKGIAASPASGSAAHLEGQAQQGTLPADVRNNPALSASAPQSSVDAALAAGSGANAHAAAQNAVQASSGNAGTLAHGLHATAAAAASHSAGAVSADSNGKIQSSSGDSSSAGHAHAASGRDAAATPAQGQGSGAGISIAVNGQVQAVSAAGHAALNGPDARGASGVPAGSASGVHSGDPFSTLDSGSATNSRIDSIGDSTTWMHAGTHAAEAGFQDPSLGWVAVRAQLSNGAVQASILPASADAAQALGGHLAGLHAYLADHHALEGTVTMARPQASAGWSGAGHSQGQGSGQGSSYGGNQGGDAPFYGSSSGGHPGNPQQQQPGSATLEGVRGISRATAVPATAAVRTSPSIASRGGGLISVMA